MTNVRVYRMRQIYGTELQTTDTFHQNTKVTTVQGKKLVTMPQTLTRLKKKPMILLVLFLGIFECSLGNLFHMRASGLHDATSITTSSLYGVNTTLLMETYLHNASEEWNCE